MNRGFGEARLSTKTTRQLGGYDENTRFKAIGNSTTRVSAAIVRKKEELWKTSA
jgi:hypothetical protein